MPAKIAPDDASSRWLGSLTPGRDLARFGLSVAMAAVFSTVQVFVIPRYIDVVTYGQYRLFLVYVGYVELLNLGLVDGAFLRWAGRAPDVIRREWRVVATWLLALSGTELLLALLAAMLADSELSRLNIIALGALGLVVNAQVLATYALQAAGDFKRAGRAVMLAPGLFVACVLVSRANSLTVLLASYVAAFAVAAAYAAVCVARIPVNDALDATAPPPLSPRLLARSGYSVLGASIGAALARSVDRLLVSMVVPIASFALYGFASTVMVAASVATQALGRVALAHAARRDDAERARFLSGFLDVITAGYGAGLVAAPLFEHLVRVTLPAYVAALPIVRALIISMPLSVATHVVVVGTLQSYGRVRRQLGVEVVGVLLVLVACGASLAARVPLWQVAAATSIAGAATFGVAVVTLRRSIHATRDQSSVRFVADVVWQSAALIAAFTVSDDWRIQSATYAVFALVPTWLAARRTWQHGW